jgi:hypothetical protein
MCEEMRRGGGGTLAAHAQAANLAGGGGGAGGEERTPEAPTSSRTREDTLTARRARTSLTSLDLSYRLFSPSSSSVCLSLSSLSPSPLLFFPLFDAHMQNGSHQADSAEKGCRCRRQNIRSERGQVSCQRWRQEADESLEESRKGCSDAPTLSTRHRGCPRADAVNPWIDVS